MFGGINPRHAPVPWLPLPFLLSAPLAFAAGHLLLADRATGVLGSYRSTSALAVTHLLILGGVVAAMMGALYQLAPVVFVAVMSYRTLSTCPLSKWHAMCDNGATEGARLIVPTR